MTGHTIEFGQPISLELPDWIAPLVSRKESVQSYYCRVKPFDIDAERSALREFFATCLAPDNFDDQIRQRTHLTDLTRLIREKT